MIHFPIPYIFWSSAAGAFLTLFLATIVGRGWAIFLPTRYAATARFYLAPALGVATLTVVNNFVGWHFALGTPFLAQGIALVLLILALSLEVKRTDAVLHALAVGGFGLICGASSLFPLLKFGAINPHNDTFTYLAHSTWLQSHAFSDTVPGEDVTSLSSQIAGYQRFGLRMGASFLLAFEQALFAQRWAFRIYPALQIAAMSACTLSIGMALARPLRVLPRWARFALLTIPALGTGGLEFAANLGFLPQMVGACCAAGVLFLFGVQLKWVSRQAPKLHELALAAVPAAIMFVGVAFAYSEMLPFVTLAIVLSTGVVVLRGPARTQVLCFAALVGVYSAIVLNTELLRIFLALQGQSHAIVGGPVPWPLLGFIAHAVGAHGAAWDVFQWLLEPINRHTRQFEFGVILFGLTVLSLIASVRQFKRYMLYRELLPTTILLLLFFAAIVYFRYFVAAPFPTGMGQSWSEFKLSDWANPFAMALVLLGALRLRSWIPSNFNRVLTMVVVLGFVASGLGGVARNRPLMDYYGVRNLDRFYLNFRSVVLSHCAAQAPIFLALDSGDQKFREMATLYLDDRVLKSDWTTDGYINPLMTADHRTEEKAFGDCVVERVGQANLLRHSEVIGRFGVGMLDQPGIAIVTAMTEGYGQEGGGNGWWRWVEHKVAFGVRSALVSSRATQTEVSFGYGARGPQDITVRLLKTDGRSEEFVIHAANGDGVFDKVLNWPVTQLDQIIVESDGKATPLSASDSRNVAWVIRNVSAVPLFPKS